MSKILVAVSEPDRVSDLMLGLWGDKHSVIIVSDGLVAWNLIRDAPPDVLFIEELLTGLDGYELLTKVSQKFGFSTIRVVLAILISNTSVPAHDWQDPIDSYLVKPYSPWQAILSIEQFLYRKIEPNTAALENLVPDRYLA